MVKTMDSFAEMNEDIKRVRIRELNGRIADLEKKIEEDTVLIEEERRKSMDSYNPVISGARHRISQNRNLLERYRKELRKINKLLS